MTRRDDHVVEEALRALGRRFAELDAPPGLAAAVRRRVEAEQVRPGRRLRVTRPVALIAAAAAIMVVALGGVLVLGRSVLQPDAGYGASALPQQRAVTLEQARAMVPIASRVPPEWGPPDRVVVGDGDRPGVMVLSYTVGGRQVVLEESVPGALQIGLHGETRVVGNHLATWLPGVHEERYLDATGAFYTRKFQASRLVWIADGITFALQADVGFDELAALARQVSG
ncbi:hypothetical protein [Amycolatopsis anabasis]|uniref:hypothetical protein n=1 Tax=Amycolatopsis anabasis TaxID=1840409 RepID=UPI00131AA4F9|nr:hypothetical protein [Amycolatopsis anabasis]